VPLAAREDAEMLIEGDKVLVVHRRLFRGDVAHYLVGQVDAYEAGLVKVTGHSYVRDPITGRMIEKTEPLQNSGAHFRHARR